MRKTGAFLLLLGLVAAVLGVFSGCGSLFTWNGRHAIETYSLPDDVALKRELVPVAGRRYVLSVEVVFAREGLPKREGVILVDAKMPLVVTVTDRAGTTLAEVKGWLDPNEPPTVLYGQAAHESVRGPTPELVALRLVGPFIVASSLPITVEVNLGPDRIGTAHIKARRLVIHDDVLPPSIRNAFILAAGGGGVFAAGTFLVILGWWRGRRSSRPVGARGSRRSAPLGKA